MLLRPALHVREVLAQELGDLARGHEEAAAVLAEVVRGDEGLDVRRRGGGDAVEERLLLGVEAVAVDVGVPEVPLGDGARELVEHARVDVAQARDGGGGAQVPLQRLEGEQFARTPAPLHEPRAARLAEAERGLATASRLRVQRDAGRAQVAHRLEHRVVAEGEPLRLHARVDDREERVGGVGAAVLRLRSPAAHAGAVVRGVRGVHGGEPERAHGVSARVPGRIEFGAGRPRTRHVYCRIHKAFQIAFARSVPLSHCVQNTRRI